MFRLFSRFSTFTKKLQKEISYTVLTYDVNEHVYSSKSISV